jgi:hypothetical protein
MALRLVRKCYIGPVLGRVTTQHAQVHAPHRALLARKHPDPLRLRNDRNAPLKGK